MSNSGVSPQTSTPAPKPPAAVAQARAAAEAMSSGALLAWMFRFLKPVKPLVALALAYLALTVGLEVLVVWQTGSAINHIKALSGSPAAQRAGFWYWIRSGEGQELHWTSLGRLVFRTDPTAPLRDIILVLVVLTGMMLFMRYMRIVSESKLSMTLVYYLREAVYDKLQRVGFSFHDAISSGQLINRALSDLQNVRAFVQTAVLQTMEILLVITGYEVMLFSISPWVAALSFIPMPIWVWYILRFSIRVQPANKQVLEAGDRDVSIITENIAGVHVVKAFATEKQEIAKYGKNADGFYDVVMRRIRMFANFNPVIRAIAMGSYLSMFLLAGVLAIYRKLDVGDFMRLGSAMGAILGRLQFVSTINEQYQNAIVSARRLYEVLMAPPTVPELPGAKPLPPGNGGVRFENVSFGYDPQKPVLHEVSFEVPGNSIVAIVGPTGAGKSTLVNLIARFYDPQGGRVLIDGMDVREASLASIRTQVAFVFQETYLFSDTVSGNIAYGRPGISRGDIEASARLAQAHEFIEELPKRYETVLGERGASLSGGQRQRLAIARAILTNPRVLVLDDATASVDPETEDMIRRGMRFVMQGRTTFVIAHRISTVKQADVVIVLEEGRITQVGTHDELMRQEGHYRDIAFAQLYGDEGPPQKPEPASHMDRVVHEQAPAGVAAEEQQRQEEV